jgi:HEAT repeat protein/GTPase SAR1 family protein
LPGAFANTSFIFAEAHVEYSQKCFWESEQMDLAGLGLGKAITSVVARKVIEAGIKEVTQKLKVSEVEKALAAALQAAQAQVGELLPSLNADNGAWLEEALTQFLGSGIGLEELQKPLHGSEKPNVQVLVTAFEQSMANNPQLSAPEPDFLNRWMSCFVETYFECTKTFIRYLAKRKEYQESLITNCENIKFVGMDVSTHENHRSSRLMNIFVVPNVAEVTAAKSISQELDRDLSPDLTEQQAELWLEQRQRFGRPQGSSESAHQMLTNHRRRVVLLGDPGIGKTTLMRYFAVKVARQEGADFGLAAGAVQLPILVYMRDWARHPERSLLEQMRDYAENTLQLQLPPGFFEHWTDGQALFLLDGLDEVAEDATRNALVEKINCFLTAHPDNWAVITSRPWGYRPDYFQTESYPHFELELFNKEQINEFIEHWYTNRCESNIEAQTMIRDLQEALQRKDRLQELVRNPLLLTMVALIHRYQDVLPKRRYKLYDKAVDTLLKSWDRKGKGENYGEFKHLDREDDLRRVISQLAYWVHTQYETQTTESGTLIEEADLMTQLSQIIRSEYPNVKPNQAEGEAKRFVIFIRDRAGLLNEYGRGRYAFVHKTFQEYLTAEAILKKAEYEDNSDIIYDIIKIHLHKPHWREVLLLLVGQLQGKKAATAIELILRNQSDYERWLSRDLLFAGRCLTEDPAKLATATAPLVSEILQKLVCLEASENGRIGFKTKGEVFEILGWLKETAFETEALEFLKASRDDIKKFRFIELQALLGEKEYALANLLTLLRDEDSNVRFNAAMALGELGQGSEVVIQALLTLLRDENSYVRSNAASTLGKLGQGSEAVIQALPTLLRDEDSNVRFNAAMALGELGQGSEVVIQALLTLLRDENSYVRSNAASTLGELGQGSEAVIQALPTLLRDEDSNVRFNAVSALGKLGQGSEAVIQALLTLLRDENPDVSKRAAMALGELGQGSEVVIQALLTLLRDENPDVSKRAAMALGELGQGSEVVIQALLTLLRDENSYVRSNAAITLGELDQGSEAVIQALLTLLRDKNSYVRSNAASALGKLGQGSEAVIQALLTLLRDENPNVIFNAASALGKLGQGSEVVIQALLTLLRDEDSSVRFNAVSALGELDQGSEAVIQALLTLLRDEDSSVRFNAVSALVKLEDNSELLIENLISLLCISRSIRLMSMIITNEGIPIRLDIVDALIKFSKSEPNIPATLATWIEEHPEVTNLGNAIDALWEIIA